MKEFKLEDITPIEKVKTKIWSIFDILRKDGVGLDDSYIILLFLSLYKDNLISKDFLFNESQSISHEFVNGTSTSQNAVSKYYQPIIDTLGYSILNIKKQAFRDIISILYEIDKEVLSQNFPYIFESVLLRITQAQGRFSGEFIQPVELTRFICALADLPKKSKVFNPFAGLASFGVFLNDEQDYFGQELNKKTWALGALRILAYERPGTSKYFCDDSILHWPPTEKFDLIVANPPFGIRLSDKYKDAEPDFRTIEQFLLEKGVHSLNENGKLIALLPQGILFRGMYEQQLRKYLVNEDLIDTIISLPAGLLLNTGIPLVIIVLNRNKKNPGKVRFIDAKKYVTSKNSREKVLNDFALNSVVHGIDHDSDAVQIISNEKIIASDYNLNVPRYFQKKIEGIKLGHILEFIGGNRKNLPESGKVIRISDLKDNIMDFKLDVSNINSTKFRRPGITQISQTCLLLALHWKTLKPTLFEFKGEPIFRGQEILSFKINESIVDSIYLINELHADYVQEQLESYGMVTSVDPFIRRDDLLEIVIKLPSLEEQKAKVQGIFEFSNRIKNLQEERNILAHDKSIKQFNEFASLKHTLGRPRQNILDWSDNLLHFLNKNRDSFEELNADFEEFYEIDMISALREIKRDINFITDVLEKGENGFVLEEFEKQLIPLADINSIVNDISSNGFNFKITKLLIKGEKLKERGICGNKTLFKTLLDNLLTNASKYGFDKKEVYNEVVIELTELEDVLFVEVRNNGLPFPKNFDREKFITKYSTANTNSGTGLGGYDIHRIATDFKNPEWILSLNEDQFYPVKFKFQFPVKLIR